MGGNFLEAKYTLEKGIAVGATALIYSGYDRRYGNRVAIKSFLREEQIEREVGIMSQLTHQNIIPLIDSGLYKGTRCIVTPLAEGSLYGRLQDIDEKNTLLALRSLRVIQQIGSALTYMHQKGIGHLDITLSNILLKNASAFWLADFGSSQFFGEPLEDNLLTSRLYKAPEQYSRVIIPENDQYSLGVLAYALLTGRHPFYGSADELKRQHLKDNPLTLEEVLESIGHGEMISNLTRALDRVVRRAMGKKPEQRYPSVQAFVIDFQDTFNNVQSDEKKYRKNTSRRGRGKNNYL